MGTPNYKNSNVLLRRIHNYIDRSDDVNTNNRVHTLLKEIDVILDGITNTNNVNDMNYYIHSIKEMRKKFIHSLGGQYELLHKYIKKNIFLIAENGLIIKISS